MKNCTILIVLLIACLAGCKSAKRGFLSSGETKEIFHQLIKAKDSGYITKDKGLDFLLSAALTDTVESYWNQLEGNDTIGRYYRNERSGSYFLCLVDLSIKYSFETHLLMEVKPNGDILKKERFFHGNYPCCWNNYYEGFRKYGDYFGIKTCGTGSGYCASHLYLFKEIISQENQTSIADHYWSSFGVTQNFTSEMELKKEVLIMHYTLEEGDLNDSLEFKVNTTRMFDVRFVFKDNKWTTTEMDKFDGMDF